jgi:hypothetical protein
MKQSYQVSQLALSGHLIPRGITLPHTPLDVILAYAYLGKYLQESTFLAYFLYFEKIE